MALRGGRRRPRARPTRCWPMPAMISPPASSGPIRCLRPAPMPTSWRSGIRKSSRRKRDRMVVDFDTFTAELGRRNACALPGSKEAIARLHASGYRLGVATNDSTSGAEKTLLTLGIAQMFDAAYGYDAVANPKPAPDTIVAFSRPHRPEAVRDRHGRRQPPRPRNGAGRRAPASPSACSPAPARARRWRRWPTSSSIRSPICPGIWRRAEGQCTAGTAAPDKMRKKTYCLVLRYFFACRRRSKISAAPGSATCRRSMPAGPARSWET